MEYYYNTKIKLYGGLFDRQEAFVMVDENGRHIGDFIEVSFRNLASKTETFQREIYKLETLCKNKTCWLIGLHDRMSIQTVIDQVNKQERLKKNEFNRTPHIRSAWYQTLIERRLHYC